MGSKPSMEINANNAIHCLCVQHMCYCVTIFQLLQYHVLPNYYNTDSVVCTHCATGKIYYTILQCTIMQSSSIFHVGYMHMFTGDKLKKCPRLCCSTFRVSVSSYSTQLL